MALSESFLASFLGVFLNIPDFVENLLLLCWDQPDKSLFCLFPEDVKSLRSVINPHISRYVMPTCSPYVTESKGN